MKHRLRWGILGTGNIANQFAAGVLGSERSQLTAVGSRDQARAQQFAARYEAPRAWGSYEQVLADAEVEAVYISLPNSQHHEWTIRALEAGKHVLCEKPLAVTSAQASEMFAAAQRCRRVLVEAFMYRSHPLTQGVIDMVRSGRIGRVRLIRTSFCYRTTRVQDNIRFDAALAGGALMDIGCYCVHFSRLIAGSEPTQAQVSARLHASGVDEMAMGTLHFPGDAAASFVCGMTLQANNAAVICGDEGYIEIPVPWKPPVNGASFTVAHMTAPRQDGPRATPPSQTLSFDACKPLYALEADDFAAAVFDGASPRITREDSIQNLRVLEQLRQQAGLRF